MSQMYTSPSGQHTSPFQKSKCKVMLVDDSLVVRGILRKILISDPEIELWPVLVTENWLLNSWIKLM